MFYEAREFNGDVSDWDVSSVTDMDVMFYEATEFNGDVSDWDVSSVTTMSWMFAYATEFNGDFSDWDVSSVTTMSGWELPSLARVTLAAGSVHTRRLCHLVRHQARRRAMHQA